MNSIVDGGALDSQFPRPFGTCHIFAVVFNPAISSLIICLRFLICPSAIGRGIGSVIVNPVKAGILRRITHIFEEIGERFSPTIANLNSTLPVVSVGWIARVGAAIAHPRPSHINSGRRHSVLSDTKVVISEAPATARQSSLKRRSGNYPLPAAVTFTFPINGRSAPWLFMSASIGKNREFPKSLAGQVNKPGIIRLRIKNLHFATLRPCLRIFNA